MTLDQNTPASLSGVAAALGVEISSVRALAGGDVSGAILVAADNGSRFIVKRNPTAKAGMFDAEADGLSRLGASRQIRVPEVLAVRDGEGTAPEQRFIAMEYVPEQPGDAIIGRGAAFGRRFGAALGRLHRANPSPSNEYGLDRVSFLGRRSLDNAWRASWGEFYLDQRITPVLPECRHTLGTALTSRVEALALAIPHLLAGMPHAPRLIHGDLWSGNYLISDGEPVLIDPAAYYGHPEHEWAYIELFGGFPPALREGYDSVSPLDAGYERRRPLLQLFHILVHVAHFGQQYVPAVNQVCRAYGF